MTGFKIGIAGFFTVITGFLGGWDLVLKALFIFIVLDYITGFLAASVKKKVSSSVGFIGITRKCCILILVAVGVVLDGVLGLSDPWIRTGIIYFYLMNEGISILENLALVGVPVPPFVKNILMQLRQDEQNERKIEKYGGILK